MRFRERLGEGFALSQTLTQFPKIARTKYQWSATLILISGGGLEGRSPLQASRQIHYGGPLVYPSRVTRRRRTPRSIALIYLERSRSSASTARLTLVATS